MIITKIIGTCIVGWKTHQAVHTQYIFYKLFVICIQICWLYTMYTCVLYISTTVYRLKHY